MPQLAPSPILPACQPAVPVELGDALDAKWVTLMEVASLVERLAGDVPPGQTGRIDGVHRALTTARPWQREFIGQSIEDLAAVMEPGIAALLAISAEGGDASRAARALWREFESARDALCAVLPSSDS